MDSDSGCTTDVKSGDIAVTCDLSVKDTLNQCLDKGGPHHLLHLEYACNNFSLDAKNIPMCVGASCNIDDMTSTASAKEKMDKQIGDNISNYPIISVDDKCGTKKFDVTKSTPATKNTSGERTNNDSNSDSNNKTHTNTNNNNNSSSSLGNPSIHLNTLICFVF